MNIRQVNVDTSVASAETVAIAGRTIAVRWDGAWIDWQVEGLGSGAVRAVWTRDAMRFVLEMLASQSSAWAYAEFQNRKATYIGDFGAPVLAWAWEHRDEICTVLDGMDN